MSARSSLRFRLMAANILTKQVVIIIAGVFLLAAFDRLIYRQTAGELDAVVDQLASNLVTVSGGKVALNQQLADPRFRDNHSGWYWQVAGNGSVLKSPSLGATDLLGTAGIPPPDGAFSDAGALSFQSIGPAGQDLTIRAHKVTLANSASGADGGGVVVLVGRNTADLAKLAREFRNDLIFALGSIAGLLLISAWFQMKLALKSAETLRLAIQRIRLGLDRRIGPGFPDELQPLISEANRLLEYQDGAIAKARARAGDLAHGLKTPLTAIGMLAERLRQDGEHSIAHGIVEQIENASRHIDRELARTRIAVEHGSGFNTNFGRVAGRVLSTMEKLPRGDDVDWILDAETGTCIAVDEADSVEILGNLLDNARKWARSTVSVRAKTIPEAIEIRVEDDGPGVAEDGHDQVLRRGVRLDESSPGTGLGLTIVKDVVEAYGGTIGLYRAELGGLGVRLCLPGATGQPPKTAERGGLAARDAHMAGDSRLL
jgi:signal transduction histidine kinase